MGSKRRSPADAADSAGVEEQPGAGKRSRLVSGPGPAPPSSGSGVYVVGNSSAAQDEANSGGDAVRVDAVTPAAAAGATRRRAPVGPALPPGMAPGPGSSGDDGAPCATRRRAPVGPALPPGHGGDAVDPVATASHSAPVIGPALPSPRQRGSGQTRRGHSSTLAMPALLASDGHAPQFAPSRAAQRLEQQLDDVPIGPARPCPRTATPASEPAVAMCRGDDERDERTREWQRVREREAQQTAAMQSQKTTWLQEPDEKAGGPDSFAWLMAQKGRRRR